MSVYRKPASCADLYTLKGIRESGTYPILVAGENITVYCDMETSQKILFFENKELNKNVKGAVAGLFFREEATLEQKRIIS